MKLTSISNRKATHMKGIQNWKQKFFSFLALCFLIVIGISACDINTNADSTTQICNGAVNVNSCTSSNSDIQNTVIAGWQLNTANQEATAQTNLDATVTAQTAVQNTTAREESIVSTGNIIIPIAFVISVIAFFASFSEDQDSTTVKAVTAIIAILLLIMLILMLR